MSNPYYMVTALEAGNYILAIGAYPLSDIDAWQGINSDGNSWDSSVNNYYNIHVTSTE